MATKNTKYKLIRAGRMAIHRTDQKKWFYRLQALRDIPLHNVKAGDLGGYVTRKDTLSITGDSWIGGKAQVIGLVSVDDEVYIGDEAVIQNTSGNYSHIFKVYGNAKIYGHATVLVSNPTGRASIYEDAQIYGNAYLFDVYRIHGTTHIYDNARLGATCSIRNSKISGDAQIGVKTDLIQANISGTSDIGNSVEIRYSVISGTSFVGDKNKFSQMVIKDERIEAATLGQPQVVKYIAPSAEDVIKAKEQKKREEEEEKNKALAESKENEKPVAVRNAMVITYEQVREKIAAYETDIVKIIKYPVMADKTDPLTLDMVMALNNAELFASEPEGNEFKEAVIALQKAFIMAESNARKIASSLLSETEKRKASKATDLFKIASNEASSEQEKKVAFIQGFKQLEGVLDVPDVAVDAFRIKIGLPELEM